MIKKILIAEDIDSINTGIITILKKRFNFVIDHANSCDNAYLKLLNATQNHSPYDLLITDLSFKNNGFLEAKLNNGEELIQAVKKEFPIKTIVYTIEDKPSLIKRLKDVRQVNGMVIKGPNSLNELCTAIESIAQEKDYFSTEVLHLIKNDSTLVINNYDIYLLTLLSQGLTQQEISQEFKNKLIKPSSVSSIEKRIGELKMILNANNSIHMISIAKDMCLI